MTAALPPALAQRLAALSPAQRQLLQQRLAEQGLVLDADSVPPVSDAVPTGPLALTPAQQQLWVIQRMQPDSTAYHIAFAWQLQGALQVVALQQALQALVQRHDALRTVFSTGADGQPQQRVLAQATLDLPLLDLRGQAGAGTDAQALDARLQAWSATPFDLARAPLLRVQLLRLDDGPPGPQGTPGQRWVLAWQLHHLVADGWSRGVLQRDLAVLYGAACQGRALQAPGLLPALAASHAQAVQRRLAWLASPAAQADAQWWRQRLAGLQPLALPTDRPHGPTSGWQSHTLQLWLPDLAPQLAAGAARCGATPFMLLLAVFQLLLARWSGQHDLAVAVPVAGREADDEAGLVGFFVNTVVVRCQGPDPARHAARVQDWVDLVKRSVADVFDHARLPLARVIDAVGAPREPGRAPLVATMFQYQGEAYGTQNALAGQLPGLALQQQPLLPAHTKFDLTWHAIARDGGLLLAVEYRQALFDAPRIQRWLQHFQTLLQGVLADPDQLLARLPMLADDERAQLAHWQQGPAVAGAEVAAEPGFLARFAAQVQRCPQAVAVAVPAGADGAPGPASAAVDASPAVLSYQALDAASNRLATRLRAAGVGPEVVVGVCLPRRPVLMVALLAVWKAGGAWLALDPVLPAERLGWMLHDAGAPVLLAGPDDAGRLLGTAGAAGRAGPVWLDPTELLSPQSVAETGADRDPARPAEPAPAPAASQLAYVLYTSGSTGRPKGTLLPHGGLMHYLRWCLARYPLGVGRGAPVNSSIGFDATITGLLAPLLVGSTVTLLPDADAGQALAGLADALGAGHSLVKLTPAHMNALAPLLQAQGLPAAAQLPQALVIGGEALTEAHVAFWRQHCPGIALLNEYGPTETVVGCCVHEVGPQDRGSLPIGRPIGGAAVYLLDAALQPVPAGAVGELYIGGAGMARGYLGRPALTAERFLPDPVAAGRGQAGAVMYRSGDLARWRPDGSLDYLGRADQQLKLRGHRIEPGEVEAALVRQPGVAEAVVGVLPLGQVPTLVAWLRPQDPAAPPDLVALRQALAAWLPAPMVPGQLLLVAGLPLNANGKVDRAALPWPGQAAADAADPAGDPDSQRAADAPALAALRSAWQAVLGRQQIGPDDNFFDLGGDSIAAMQIIGRLHQAGWQLSPLALFSHQTLLSQAAALRPLDSAQPLHTDLTAEGRPHRLAPAQHAFLARVQRGEIPQPAHWNQSLLLLLDPLPDLARLHAALQAWPRRHAALRLRFAPGPAESSSLAWRAWHGPAAPLPLAMHDLADAAPGDSRSLDQRLADCITAEQGALALADGLLLRAAVLNLGPQRGHRLLLVAHHLVVDGLSWRLLLAELAADLLSDPMPGAAASAPPLAGWTAALPQRLPALTQQLPFWQQMLQPAARLPRRAGAPDQAQEADTHDLLLRLDAATTIALDQAARALQSQPQLLLLAALAQTLQPWARADALTIDIEHHGRDPDWPDAARSVGWFTATWPLRLALPSGAPMRQLAALHAAWAAVPHDGLGFGVLQQAGQLPASTADISFNHLGRLQATALGPLRGLAPEPVPAQRCPLALRSHLLELVSWQQGDSLHWRWRHDNRLGAATVQALGRRALANLHSLVALAGSAA